MFTADRRSLLDALTLVNKLAGGPTHALLVASEDNGLVVAAGTAERGARCALTAGRVLLPGEALIPVKPTLQLLGRSAAQKVELASNNTTTALALDPDAPCSRSVHFARPTDAAPVADRPGEVNADATSVELTSHAFAALVGRTGFAVARRGEGHGWSLDALSITARSGQLVLSATDAYRYATAAAPAATPTRCDSSFLVRERTIRDWLAALKATESLKLSIGTSLIVRANSFAAWAAPHPGPFPPMSAVPADGPHSVAVPVAAFRSAVETALGILDATDPPVSLTLKRGALVVSATRGATRAESSVPCPAAADAPPLSVRVDGFRLLGALEAYAAMSSVTLHYHSDAGQPITLAVPDARTVFVPHVQRDLTAPTKRAKPQRSSAADDDDE